MTRGDAAEETVAGGKLHGARDGARQFSASAGRWLNGVCHCHRSSPGWTTAGLGSLAEMLTSGNGKSGDSAAALPTVDCKPVYRASQLAATFARSAAQYQRRYCSVATCRPSPRTTSRPPHRRPHPPPASSANSCRSTYVRHRKHPHVAAR